MPYYKKCLDCGAALDPGEHCDCRRQTNVLAIRRPTVEIALKEDDTRQLVLEMEDSNAAQG